MQELINMLKEFDTKHTNPEEVKNGVKMVVGNSVRELDSTGVELFDRLMDIFDDVLIQANGRFNRTYWNELKAQAAHQGYELTGNHGGDDGDAFGLETPAAIYWIDCVY